MIRYYTAAEIALAYDRPLGTVYRLAAHRQWRRIDDQRPVLYRIEDVEATFATLRAYQWRAEERQVS